jgi:predicted amidohydrolase
VDRAVTVACVQAEPVVLDLERTLDKLEHLASEAARNGA